MTIIVKEEKSARDNHVLGCNLANNSQILKKNFTNKVVQQHMQSAVVFLISI